MKNKLKGIFEEGPGTLAFIVGIIILAIILFFLATQVLGPVENVSNPGGLERLFSILGGSK